MTYQEQYDAYKGQVEANLAQACAKVCPEKLKEGMEYSLLAGGKRLRPVLCLATYALFSRGETQIALPFASAMEMIHTYSLIHDDLPCMDDDDLRRGRPTNHKVYGEALAVLAGDGLLSLAFSTIAEALQHLPKEKVQAGIAAYQAIADGCGAWGMVSGQVMDLENEKNPHPDIHTLKQIHRLKTGGLIRGACLCGASLGEADEEQMARIKEYGERLGIAFQIADDILDATQSAEQLGKTPGKDARDQKLTYVTHYGLEGARKLAKDASDQAQDALSIFQDRADFLRQTAKNAVNRSK